MGHSRWLADSERQDATRMKIRLSPNETDFHRLIDWLTSHPGFCYEWAWKKNVLKTMKFANSSEAKLSASDSMFSWMLMVRKVTCKNTTITSMSEHGLHGFFRPLLLVMSSVLKTCGGNSSNCMKTLTTLSIQYLVDFCFLCTAVTLPSSSFNCNFFLSYMTVLFTSWWQRSDCHWNCQLKVVFRSALKLPCS